jgi:hypothetical protein
MSAKGKSKADDTASVTSDNKNERILTPATTTTMIELKKDTLIKIREPAIFTEDRIKFTIYKISISLTVWTDNKKEKPNKIIKTVPEQIA